MKKMLVTVVCAIALCGLVNAETHTDDQVFKGKVNFDTPACDLRIGNVKLTATAAELNIMDGVTATADEINLATAMKTAQVGSVTVAVATNANGGTNVATFVAKDLAGTQVTGYHTLMFYVVDSIYGAPAAVAGDIVISGTGAAELGYLLDKGFYAVSMSNGTFVATITDTPGGTNYIHTINSAGVISAPTTSAFKIP